MCKYTQQTRTYRKQLMRSCASSLETLFGVSFATFSLSPLTPVALGTPPWVRLTWWNISTPQTWFKWGQITTSSLPSCLKTAHALKHAGRFHLPGISDAGSKEVIRAACSSLHRRKQLVMVAIEPLQDPLLPQYKSWATERAGTRRRFQIVPWAVLKLQPTHSFQQLRA